MPLMQLSTLVLPAPFGPISANSSPRSTAKRHAVEHQQAAEAQRQRVDLKLSHTISGCGDIA